MRLWIVLNVWDGKITKFSKNKTVKCYHFVRFCNRARIRLCVLTWLCIICFICCCCTLNCCFCCLAWRCSCCLWSSSSSFLRSVSLGVFSAKYWKQSVLALLFLPLLFTVFFSMALFSPEWEASPLFPAFTHVVMALSLHESASSSSGHLFCSQLCAEMAPRSIIHVGAEYCLLQSNETVH